MTQALHPDDVLHQHAGGAFFSGPSPSACEHYAGDEKKLRKALALQDELHGTFDVTADLEDGAPSGKEAETAKLLASILAEPRQTQHPVGCRVHPADHPAFKDDVRTLLSAKPAGLAYITIPKIAGRAQLDGASAFIDDTAKNLGLMSPPPLQVLVEDEAAAHEVFEIAAHPRIRFIAFGQMDFVSSHHGGIGGHAMKSPGQFDHPLMRRAKLEIAAACHAFGKIATHNPTTDAKSPTQAHQDALRARHEFGFTRMWSIHPNQIRPIVAAMSPSEREVETASKIIAAAAAVDWAPISFDSQLHDRASYRYFWQLLERAHRTGRALPPEVAVYFAPAH